GIIEYIDSPQRRAREEIVYYPIKIPVDTTVPFDLRFSYTREWTTDTILTQGTDYWWDSFKNALIIYNTYEVHHAKGAYQLTYAGGIPLIPTTDVYDCASVGMDNLRDL